MIRALALCALVLVAACGEPVVEVSDFGKNPGHLRMFEHVPDHVAEHVDQGAPLVVILHGCTQTHDIASSSGLVDRADERGFVVVAPEQSAFNNPQLCFNWFLAADNVRDSGELASIKAMINHARKSEHGNDAPVFVMGLSAGAAMATSMLAAYPDVVAGGASFAGPPYGCANSIDAATACLAGTVAHSASEWRDLVAGAGAPSDAPMPRVLIEQGDNDPVVNPKDADALVDQWTAVAHVASTPTSTHDEGAATVDDFGDPAGDGRVRRVIVHGLGHALPVVPSKHCGTVGPFATDDGICAIDTALDYFGLE